MTVESQPKESMNTADTDATADAESDSEATVDSEDAQAPPAKRRLTWSRVLAFGVLPGLALLLAMGAGFLKWQDSWARASASARIESVVAAKDSTIALLSYQPDTAEKTLTGARERLTGNFKEAYTQLIRDMVIPGSKQQHVSVTATVPAAASVSATPTHAVTLLFVNETAVIGSDRPTDSISSVRVTLDKIGGRWLIYEFNPV
ncbi:hypothetical protein [uncultured Mycobacterium sp.]|uniref:hypothetical protein n=1 Tax=uncultured Mycobacterium sp. TaxID=171292 RepID=UPI0035CA1E74